jgi:hypothetical protein
MTSRENVDRPLTLFQRPLHGDGKLQQQRSNSINFDFRMTVNENNVNE